MVERGPAHSTGQGGRSFGNKGVEGRSGCLSSVSLLPLLAVLERLLGTGRRPFWLLGRRRLRALILTSRLLGTILLLLLLAGRLVVPLTSTVCRGRSGPLLPL